MLRHMANEELFQLYDGDPVLGRHSVKNPSDTRKVLAGLKEHLNGYSLLPELAGWGQVWWLSNGREMGHQSGWKGSPGPSNSRVLVNPSVFKNWQAG